LLPDVTPDSYSALGLVTRSNTGLSDFLSVPGMSGTFQYSSAAFDRLEFRFSPADPYQAPPDINGISPSPVVGMTIASISDVSASPVPEPASGLLFGAGCGLLLVGRVLKRRRAN